MWLKEAKFHDCILSEEMTYGLPMGGYAGYPVIAIPFITDDGSGEVTVELVTRKGNESLLFQLADLAGQHMLNVISPPI